MTRAMLGDELHEAGRRERSTKAGVMTPAMRERLPERGLCWDRSTKAGVMTPAMPARKMRRPSSSPPAQRRPG